MPTPFNLPDLDQDELFNLQPEQLSSGEKKRSYQETGEARGGIIKPYLQFKHMLDSPDVVAGAIQGPWNAITNLGNAIGDKIQGKPIDISDNYLHISNEAARRANILGRPLQYFPKDVQEKLSWTGLEGEETTASDDYGLGAGGVISGEAIGWYTGSNFLKYGGLALRQINRLGWLKTLAQHAAKYKRLDKGLDVVQADRVRKWIQRAQFGGGAMAQAAFVAPFLDQSNGNFANVSEEMLTEWFGSDKIPFFETGVQWKVPFQVEEGDNYLDSTFKGAFADGILPTMGILGIALPFRKAFELANDARTPSVYRYAEVMDEMANTDIGPYKFGTGGTDTTPVPKPPAPSGDLPPGVRGGDLDSYLDRPGSLTQYDSAISRAISDRTQVKHVEKQRDWLQKQGLIELGENGQWEIVVSDSAVNQDVKLMFDRIRRQRGTLIRQQTLTGEDLSEQFNELDKMEEDLIEAGLSGEQIEMPEGVLQKEYEQLDLPDTRPEMDTFLAQLNELSDKQLRDIERKVNLPAMRAAKQIKLQTAEAEISQIELEIKDIQEKIELGKEQGGYTAVGGKRQLNKATQKLEEAKGELVKLQEAQTTETLVGPQIDLSLEGDLTVAPPAEIQVPPKRAQIEWVNRDSEALVEREVQRKEISNTKEKQTTVDPWFSDAAADQTIDVQGTRIDEPLREFFTTKEGAFLLPEEAPAADLEPVSSALAKADPQTPLRFFIRQAPKSEQAGIAFNRLIDAFDKFAEGAPGGAKRAAGLGPVNTVGDFVNILNIGRVAIEEGTQKALRDAETTEKFRRYIAPYLSKAAKLAIKRAIADIDKTKIYFKALELEIKGLIEAGDTIGDIAERIRKGDLIARENVRKLIGKPKRAKLGVTRKATWDKRLANIDNQPMPGQKAMQGWFENRQRPDPEGPTLAEYRNELTRLHRDDLRDLAAPTKNPEIDAIVKANTGNRARQAKKADIVNAFVEYYEKTGEWGMFWGKDDVFLEMAADPSDPFILPPGEQGALNLGDTSTTSRMEKFVDADGVESMAPVTDYKPRGIPAEEREAIIKTILESAVRNGEIQPPFSPLPDRPTTTFNQGSLLDDLMADETGQLSFMYSTDQVPTYKAGGKNEAALVEEMRLRWEYQALDNESRIAQKRAYMENLGWDKLPWEEQKKIGLIPQSAYRLGGEDLTDPVLGRFITKDTRYSIKGEDLPGGSVQFSTSNPVEMAAKSADIPYGDIPEAVPPKAPPEQKQWIDTGEVVSKEEAVQYNAAKKAEKPKAKGKKRGTIEERRASKQVLNELDKAEAEANARLEALKKQSNGGICQ